MKSSLRYQSIILCLSLFFLAPRLAAQVSNVLALGPSGGIVNVVRGTANDSIVLAGTKSNGVYRSLDGGATWSQTMNNALSVNDIVFHPAAPLTVYAATQSGLYVSYDGGASWISTSLTTPTSTIAIPPGAPLIMFAGDSRPTSQGSNGVYKSTDGGLSWAPASSGLKGSKTITALTIDPTVSLAGITVYAGTDAAGIYSTTDGGNTWNAYVNNAGLAGPGCAFIPFRTLRAWV